MASKKRKIDSEQSSLFQFGISKISATGESTSVTGQPTATETKKRQLQKKAYETSRKRHFKIAWLKEFPWLTVDDPASPNAMFCQVCLDHPKDADQKGSFFTGCTSYRKGNLQTHENSVKHERCVSAKKAAAKPPEQRPMEHIVRKMEEGQREQLLKAFNTAYYVAKLELPFSTFPSLLNLQEKNGLNIGSSYRTDKACSKFIHDIYHDLLEPKLEKIAASHFISILVDAATDTSTKDLCSIYVRFLSEGKPVNMFLGIEELKHCHADGYVAAIEAVFQTNNIQNWKKKSIGFGSDGAAVMVGSKNGVAAKLRDEIPWLINIQCLGHGLELAAMDTIRKHDMMKKANDIIHGLYKQYRYSPKAWRELQAVAAALEVKIWKPSNLGGTRWVPHVAQAFLKLMKNFRPLVVQLQHTAEGQASSQDMIGRAKQVSKMLKDHHQLLFIHLVIDIMSELSKLSLKLQENEITLVKAFTAYETCLLSLTAFQTTPG